MKVTLICLVAAAVIVAGCSASKSAAPSPTLVPGVATTDSPSAAPPSPAVSSTPASSGGLTVLKSAVVRVPNEIGSASTTGYVLFRNDGIQAGSVDASFTAYDGSGQVVGTGSQSVFLVRAHATFALGANIDVPSAQRAVRITTDVHFGSDAADDPHPQSVFMTRGVRLVHGDFSDKVQGEIVSKYVATLTNVYAQAVCFNAAGAISGGGFSFVDRVIGGSTSGASINVDVLKSTTTCQLFASQSNLSVAS